MDLPILIHFYDCVMDLPVHHTVINEHLMEEFCMVALVCFGKGRGWESVHVLCSVAQFNAMIVQRCNNWARSWITICILSI